MQKKIPISLLDLVPVGEGQTIATAIKQSVELAQCAENVGFKRFWLAEHHNMAGIASAATSLLLCHIGNHTQKIRIGAGGIMLPNHSPLVIAEQFGTLATLFPDRIDLGLGRAPGSDMTTATALRRNQQSSDHFPSDVVELQYYLNSDDDTDLVKAFPGRDTKIPLWMLGSSLFGAQLAAHLGLPYAFASHFAPQSLKQATEIYRKQFNPSKQLAEPYVSIATNLVLSETVEDAEYHFTSKQQSFTNLRRNQAGLTPKPIKNIDAFWSPVERQSTSAALACSFIGTVDSVSPQIDEFLAEYQPDELIITCGIYDQVARLKTLKLAKELPQFQFI